MNDAVLKAMVWDGTGCPPPPPYPPCELVARGFDFFGTVERRCRNENARRDAEWKEATRQYDLVMESKRRAREDKP